MYTELFCKDAYLYVNRKLLKIFGLETAVYLSEIFNISMKVIKKKSFDPQSGFFKVDRQYIEDITTLGEKKQTEIDQRLMKFGFLAVDSVDPNVIRLDTELFVSIVVEEDPDTLSFITNKLGRKKTASTKSAEDKKEGMKTGLARYITETDPELVVAMKNWISACVDAKTLTKVAVESFQKKINDFSTDPAVKLRIITLAAEKAYNVADYAIKTYQGLAEQEYRKTTNGSRATYLNSAEQKVATEVSDVAF